METIRRCKKCTREILGKTKMAKYCHRCYNKSNDWLKRDEEKLSKYDAWGKLKK